MFDLKFKKRHEEILLAFLFDTAAAVYDLDFEEVLSLVLIKAEVEQEEEVALVRIVFDCILDQTEEGQLEVLPVASQFLRLKHAFSEDLDINLPVFYRRRELRHDQLDVLLRLLLPRQLGLELVLRYLHLLNLAFIVEVHYFARLLDRGEQALCFLMVVKVCLAHLGVLHLEVDQTQNSCLNDLGVGEDAVQRSHLLVRVVGFNRVLVYFITDLLLAPDDLGYVSDQKNNLCRLVFCLLDDFESEFEVQSVSIHVQVLGLLLNDFLLVSWDRFSCF